MRKYGNSFQLSITALFYRLQISDLELNKKLASVRIRIDPIIPKTPKVHRDTDQKTREDAVKLNIVEDDENVTSECCVQNRTKYPKLFQILTWIGKILEWIGNLIGNLIPLLFFLIWAIFVSSLFCLATWVLTWDIYSYIPVTIGVVPLLYIGEIFLLFLCVIAFAQVADEWRWFLEELEGRPKLRY